MKKKIKNFFTHFTKYIISWSRNTQTDTRVRASKKKMIVPHRKKQILANLLSLNIYFFFAQKKKCISISPLKITRVNRADQKKSCTSYSAKIYDISHDAKKTTRKMAHAHKKISDFNNVKNRFVLFLKNRSKIEKPFPRIIKNFLKIFKNYFKYFLWLKCSSL